MTNYTLSDILQKARLQINGRSYYLDIAKTAPFSVDKVQQMLVNIEQLKTAQEAAAARQHELTQRISAESFTLQEALSRNIAHFSATWGKKDKRLEELGGHALSAHHHKTSSPSPTTG